MANEEGKKDEESVKKEEHKRKGGVEDHPGEARLKQENSQADKTGMERSAEVKKEKDSKRPKKGERSRGRPKEEQQGDQERIEKTKIEEQPDGGRKHSKHNTR